MSRGTQSMDAGGGLISDVFLFPGSVFATAPDEQGDEPLWCGEHLTRVGMRGPTPGLHLQSPHSSASPGSRGPWSVYEGDNCIGGSPLQLAAVTMHCKVSPACGMSVWLGLAYVQTSDLVDHGRVSNVCCRPAY